MTRRAMLLGGLAAGLVACTSRRARPPGPSPDRDLVARASAAELDLLARYDATTARHPRLAARLRSLREAHAAHLAALGAGPDAPPSRAPAAPPTTGAALAALADRERAAASARIDDCTAARDGGLARLLAAIGASEAAHALVLRR